MEKGEAEWEMVQGYIAFGPWWNPGYAADTVSKTQSILFDIFMVQNKITQHNWLN